MCTFALAGQLEKLEALKLKLISNAIQSKVNIDYTSLSLQMLIFKVQVKWHVLLHNIFCWVGLQGFFRNYIKMGLMQTYEWLIVSTIMM